MSASVEPSQAPIETLEHAAVIIAGFVAQGRIGPSREDDYEAETLLAHLAVLVRAQEPK